MPNKGAWILKQGPFIMQAAPGIDMEQCLRLKSEGQRKERRKGALAAVDVHQWQETQLLVFLCCPSAHQIPSFFGFPMIDPEHRLPSNGQCGLLCKYRSNSP